MVKLKCASPRRWRTGLVLLVLVLAAPATGFPADKATITQKPEASVVAPKPGAETMPSLAEILAAMEVLETGERRLRQLLADEKRLPALAVEIDEIEKAFTDAQGLVGNVAKDLAGFHELVDLGTALREADQRLAAARADLGSKAGALDAALDRITAATAKTGIWIKTAEARNAPPDLAERIRAQIPRHEALARELLVRRDQLLEVMGRTTRLHGTVSALRDEVSGRRDQLTRGLRTEHGEPIWRVEPHPGEWSRLMRFLDVQIAQSVRHARDHAVRLLTIAVAAFALTWWLIVATRKPLAAEANTDPHARRVCSLFQVPAVAAIAAALIAVMGFGPQGPFNYQLSLWVLLTLPAVLLVRAAVGPQASLSLYTLAGAIISQALFGALLDSFPLASRLLLIVQCAALVIALGVDLVHGRFERSFPSLPSTLVRWVATGIIVLLVGGVLATVAGYLGAARVVRNVVFGALGLSLLLSVAAGLLYGLIQALMHTRAGRSLRIVRLHQQALRGGLRTGLIVATFLAWVAGMLLMLGLGDEASRLVDALYHAEITIGSTSIELTGVWAGLAVVLGTMVAVTIVGPLLEVEILPRLTRKQGLPFAVSAVTRYLLVTAGVVLAMVAMGIDLTKVTLLAGALGVGIGFGLQGVVNNFVSGLILLMERPVNVGDVVQMGQLRGVVKRIGVRSSTVQTGQGAEVIVPNADLISKEVTNWTLSDRKRRLEIDVGVAYGTEPEQVMGLLEAAAREVAEVVAKPPPLASFTGFGERSLNFRLEAWIDDYARGGATETALRMAVVRKFKEAAIEFPPPQSDPFIRAAPVVPTS